MGSAATYLIYPHYLFTLDWYVCTTIFYSLIYLIGVYFQDEQHGTVTSRPPSPFQKPNARFQTGLDQIRSQHNNDFLPPMPRPPLFSTW